MYAFHGEGLAQLVHKSKRMRYLLGNDMYFYLGSTEWRRIVVDKMWKVGQVQMHNMIFKH